MTATVTGPWLPSPSALVQPAGNILNLWPPPIKALGLMGVDVTDFGAPCQCEFLQVNRVTAAKVRLAARRRLAGSGPSAAASTSSPIFR